MGLPRDNMLTADPLQPCPQAKWHLPGFDASIQYGESSRRFGVFGAGGGALGPASLFTSGLLHLKSLRHVT